MDWTDAVRQADSEIRARFLESHVELVKYLALRVSTRLPSHVEIDDLAHDGFLGLIEAVERFDPMRGVQFKTYAETRIRGAILDGLRKRDWKPRSLRQMKRKLEAALSELASIHQRAATEDEIAGRMKLGIDEYRALLTELSTCTQLSLEELTDGGEDAAGDEHQLPNLPFERAEMIQVLGEQIDRLPERERLILELYYFKGLTMKETGAVLGVTESRVCQLHSQAAARLRVALRRRLRAVPVHAL
jgi:RNA polymerase sigma factor for flagellar operon FliA